MINDTMETNVADRVATSRARFSEKLSELSRRVDSVREAARPMQVATQPWFLFAAAGAVGFWLGVRRPTSRAERRLSGHSSPGITRLLVREVLLAAAGAYTRKLVQQRT
jgi:hypothetical protein